MKKIISLFQRNYDGDKLVRDEIVPGAEWVIAGEGIATVKYDGTCCMVRNGKLYKRYEVNYRPIQPSGEWKPLKPLPDNFEPASELDENTGKVQGWVPVGDGPDDKWHREAFATLGTVPDGTFELVGPKVQGNPESLLVHQLWRHGSKEINEDEIGSPLTFSNIKTFLETVEIEGIVWHHPDGRMVKIKAKDFGIKRA